MNTNVEELLIYKIVILRSILAKNEIKVEEIETENGRRTAKLKAGSTKVFLKLFYPLIICRLPLILRRMLNGRLKSH